MPCILFRPFRQDSFYENIENEIESIICRDESKLLDLLDIQNYQYLILDINKNQIPTLDHLIEAIDIFSQIKKELIIITPYSVKDTLLKNYNNHKIARSNGALLKLTKTKDKIEKINWTKLNFIGNSDSILKIQEQLITISKSQIDVLITGETGTGKDIVANCIHNIGPRKKDPFIAINLSALPESMLYSEIFGHEKGSFTGASTDKTGQFLQANNGCLFLDEIGTLDQNGQISLLKFLDSNTFTPLGSKKKIHTDVQVISASNENLLDSIKLNKFREDLYYRLESSLLHLPPLRERGDDVIKIAKHLLNSYSKKYKKRFKTINKSCQNFLMHYEWPGNIRELKNCLHYAIVKNDNLELKPEMLPERFLRSKKKISLPAKINSNENIKTLEEIEREHIILTLSLLKNNKVKTAESLGINRRTLYNKMDKYKIEF